MGEGDYFDGGAEKHRFKFEMRFKNKDKFQENLSLLSSLSSLLG